MSVEQTVKNQYCKFFTQNDWVSFKAMADYYYKTAAYLKKKDVDTESESKLLIRNIQKRLFIGIGTELLLKAFYLKNGYGINLPRNGSFAPYKINAINQNDYKEYDTCTMNPLIQNIEHGHIPEFLVDQQIIDGLLIAKVFRNKEGHVVVKQHTFDAQNYSDIEYAIVSIYGTYFLQNLDFQISMENAEVGQFQIL